MLIGEHLWLRQDGDPSSSVCGLDFTFEAQTLEAPPPNLQWFLFLESDPPTTGTDRESQWHILIGLMVNDVILICYMNSQILKKNQFLLTVT